MKYSHLIVCGLLFACNDGEPVLVDTSDTSVDTEDTDSTPTEPMTWTLADLNGSCSLDERVGGFEFAQWDSEGEGFSTVTGVIMSGVIPTTVLEPLESDGGCQLMRRNNPFCDPVCSAGEICTHDSECIPHPENLSAGLIKVSGLSDSLTLETDTFNNYWDTTISYPLFEAGTLISANAAGSDDVASLSLRGIGVETLDLTTPNWNISETEDLLLNWITSAEESFIYISINIDQHGNSPVTLFCDVEDTGAVTVPASMLSQLTQYGVSGFASGTIQRRTVDSMDVETGCVELQVYSEVRGSVTVDGHIPCNSDAQCPEDMHCEVAINTCVDD